MHKLPHAPAFFRYYCLLVSVMLRLGRGIRRNGGGGKGIARSSRAMTERENVRQ